MELAVSIDDIHALVATAETGSISAAAERLHTGQPVVTRRIQRLEEALGAPLLDRRVRPIVLTPLGAAVLPHCRAVVTALGAMRSVAQREVVPNTLRLGVAPALAEGVLAAATEQLRLHLPQLQLQLASQRTPKLLEGVQHDLLDAAVLQLPAGSSPPETPVRRVLARSELWVVAGAGASVPDEVELAELVEQPWVFDGPGCGFRAMVQQAFAALNATPRVVAEVQGTRLNTALVAQGVGLGMLPELVVRRAAQRQQLRRVRVRGHHYELVVWAVRRQLSAVVNEALDRFEAVLGRAWTSE